MQRPEQPEQPEQRNPYQAETRDGRWRWIRCGSKVPLLGCLCERCFAVWVIRGRRAGMERTGNGVVSDR